MRKTPGDSPHQGSKQAIYPMKNRFDSPFRLDLTPSPRIAVAYSVFP
jgi:hypothetical protein